MLTAPEIEARLRQDLPLWAYVDGAITRQYRLGEYKKSVLFVAAIGLLADAADHHPDILLTYGSVEVRLLTHDANSVTAKDFALAGKIEQIFQAQA
jgi:4a-hydroxytetrahydrobiopterin dehydratase